MNKLLSIGIVIISLAALGPSADAFAAPYDIVILNGRVIDPETGLDAVRSVGIRGDRIAKVTKKDISGDRSIDAEGLIVAPGFIDLHAHGQSIPAGRAQALDGVTTALELEAGAWPVEDFYDTAAAEGRAINYGASVNWLAARNAELAGYDSADGGLLAASGETDWRYEQASEEQTNGVLEKVQHGLNEGALGVGVLLGYAPGSGRNEYFALNKLVAKNAVLSFTHARYLSNVEPDSSFEGFEEIIAVSAATGAQMHISHLNSISLRDIDIIRPLLEAAQANGVRISVEAYPYGAGATSIGTALFEGENWQERLGGINKSDFTLNGAPLTDSEFDRLQKEEPETDIVVHFLDPDHDPADLNILAQSVLYPGGVIASDGGDWLVNGAPIAKNAWPIPANASSHPRSAGTFSKFFRVYVRELNMIPLKEALAKVSLWPAKILEDAVPQMRRKGRLQEGMDADIVIFDANKVTDRGTYEVPAQMSSGFEYVIVAGKPLVWEGVLDRTVLPGRPVRRMQAK